MWAVDLTHTTHTRAQTGIQQVCRNLSRELIARRVACPVVYDRFAGTWRLPVSSETARLEPSTDTVPPTRRSSAWTIGEKLNGYRARFLRHKPDLPAIDGIFCPEIFDPSRDRSLFKANLPPDIPHVAYFYDAIPIKHPQSTPRATVERFPAYLATLAEFDHVACISKASETDLRNYWDKAGIRPKARTSTIPLGLRGQLSSHRERPGKTSLPPNPVVLMVGTLEARKNHMSLLEACEKLWSAGMQFHLKLAGMLNRETGAPAAEMIEELASRGRPVTWEGPVSNRRLAELYGEADIFVYPSLMEGFGMPVLEALSCGIPVLTTAGGACDEVTEGGGCLLSEGTAEGISSGLEHLLGDGQVWAKLSSEARGRVIRTMQDTASELDALFQELAGRPSC